MDRSLIFVIFLASLVNISFGQYNREWTSSNLGQYGWGGAYGYDIDGDNLVEFEVRQSGQFTFYNGNYTAAWTIAWPGYDYLGVAHPRDINGDGLVVPLNTDNDAAGELVISGYYFSGATYYGRFRVYDALTRNLEFESSLLTGYYGSATVEDIDGDGRDEIILTRFGSVTTESYVDVYAFQTDIADGKKSYQLRSSSSPFPNPSTSDIIIPLDIGPGDAGKAVSVVIFDEAGRRVTGLFEATTTAQGEYRLNWDGTDDAKVRVPAGSYFVQIRIGERTETKSVTVVK